MAVRFNFRGLMVPVFTPFNNDKTKSLNLSIIPKYAEHLKKSGLEGVLVNGTTGEGVSQTVEEREKTAEAWIAAAKTTKQTIMVQVGGTNMADVKRLAAHAERIGADAILCLADLFHRPNSADQLLHYLKIVGESAPKTPLLYYHIPKFTGIDINMKEMLEKASRVPTLCGLKFTDTNLDIGSSCLQVNDGKYAVFLGSDTIFTGAIALGFDSAIATTLNFMARINNGILSAMRKHDIKEARELQATLTRVVREVTVYGSWVGTTKSLMNLVSPINVGPVRDPLTMLTADQQTIIMKELQHLKIFE